MPKLGELFGPDFLILCGGIFMQISLSAKQYLGFKKLIFIINFCFHFCMSLLC